MGDKLVVILYLFFYLALLQIVFVQIDGAKQENKDPYESLKKKSVLDYTDVDIEHLYDQWEDADDEPLEEDELPEWKRPAPKIDMSQLDPNNPEAMLQMSKKGKTLMMFVTVSGDPTEEEASEITQFWQGSLFNAHFDVQRYMVGSNRALFMLKDGSSAWDIKKFLIDQDRCEVVTIEGKDYYGKGSPQYKDNNGAKKKAETSSSKQKKKKKDEKTKKIKKNSENEILNDSKDEL